MAIKPLSALLCIGIGLGSVTFISCGGSGAGSETPPPIDQSTSLDTDGDGILDGSDAFPEDAGESADVDNDGVGANADCDDHNATINPNATEICENGIDEDCDESDASCSNPGGGDDDGDDGSGDDGSDDGDPGDTGGDDDIDNDGFAVSVDCNDADAAIYPDAPEVCYNGVDDDCDNQADSADSECGPTEEPPYAFNKINNLLMTSNPDDADYAPYAMSHGVAISPDGTVYFSDTNMSHSVYRINPDGTTTRVAGNGTYGDYKGEHEGQSATTVPLNAPSGIDVDSEGNLYIVDKGHYRIRKVTFASDGTGTITSVAGGGYDGDGAYDECVSLMVPIDVEVDSSGNVYVVELAGNRVRKLTPTERPANYCATATPARPGYQVSTVVDIPAGLESPEGISLGDDDTLYIADTDNYVIKKVDLVSGTVSTIAGVNGTSGYNDADTKASTALLDKPKDVSADAFGNVFVADSSNKRVRWIDVTTDTIATIAGDGGAEYAPTDEGASPAQVSLGDVGAVALDENGVLYIADTIGDAGQQTRIRKAAP